MSEARQLSSPSSAATRYSAEEWRVRVDLAAAYRLVALFGWDDLIFTHLSARVPGPDHHFLINPYGFLFEEITASSLVKIDLAGNPVEPTDHPVNPAGFLIHGTIHAAREDAAAVIHLHTPHGVAVSCQKDGLLPLAQQTLLLPRGIAYHEFEGIAVDAAEKELLVRNLGKAYAMILRNHGTLALGRSVAQAFLVIYTLERACEFQLAIQSAGVPLHPVRPEVIERIPRQLKVQDSSIDIPQASFAALKRRLDRVNPGYDS
ncbi:MAG: class II aldolase/adducin family protein [Alphaproteobacteria bacterium]|nr:class II aldolase/adducin family protein [Alphaproteobacteria bacterium]